MSTNKKLNLKFENYLPIKNINIRIYVIVSTAVKSPVQFSGGSLKLGGEISFCIQRIQLSVNNFFFFHQKC